MLMKSYILSVVVLTTAATFASDAVPQPSPSPVATPVDAAMPKPTPLPRIPEDAVTPVVREPARHHRLLAVTRRGNIDLLFLGDSITDRWPQNGPESWAKFASYRPGNFGVSGERTENVLWRITNGALDGLNPKVTVILIGTNNIGQCRDEKPEWAANGVKEIVDTVHAKLPNTKILLVSVFPTGLKSNPNRPRIEQLNQIISKLDDKQMTRFLDIADKFVDEKGEIPPDVMPDKLHPAPKGYDIWYNAMQPLLDEMMK